MINGNHKKYSAENHEKYKIFESFLMDNISIEEHTLAKNPDVHGIDVLVLNAENTPVGGLEAESHGKYWSTDEFPFDTVHFLHRKNKYIDVNNFYIMMNRDASTALMLPFTKLKKYKPCTRNTSLCRDELMFDIPTYECIWGWEEINKYLNKYFSKNGGKLHNASYIPSKISSFC